MRERLTTAVDWLLSGNSEEISSQKMHLFVSRNEKGGKKSADKWQLGVK